MTPDKLASSGTEHGHQVAFFAWCTVAEKYGVNVADHWNAGMGIEAAKTSFMNDQPIPELRWLHAIPNGGSRGDTKLSRMIEGGKMKAEGVKAGVSDIFFPVRRGNYSGLYIEMKKPGGTATREQMEFGSFVVQQGFAWVVAIGWKEARTYIISYLNIR